MKIRNGFVSNSSSSSFVVKTSDLTEEQIYQIKNHAQIVAGMKRSKPFTTDLYGPVEVNQDNFQDTAICYGDPLKEAWSIYVEGDTINGYTSMTNFDMEAFMRHVGIDLERVEFSDY